MARHTILCTLLSGMALAALVTSVYAQSQKEWRRTENEPSRPPKKVQKPYEGVTPGTGNSLPRVEELRNQAGTWVTWPGFTKVKDGGSQVFIQTTVSVVYEVIEKKRVITIKLKDAEVYLSNNRNPLVTTHINTPLKRAYLKKRKRDVSLVLELKQKSTFEISQRHDRDGYHYLFVDFPPGRYPTTERSVSSQTYTEYGTPSKKM